MNHTELSRIYETGNDLHLTFSRQEDARLDSVVHLWEEYQNDLKIIGNADQQINDLWNFVRCNDSRYGMQREQALTVLGAICGCVTTKSANEILLTANSPFVSLLMDLMSSPNSQLQKGSIHLLEHWMQSNRWNPSSMSIHTELLEKMFVDKLTNLCNPNTNIDTLCAISIAL